MNIQKLQICLLAIIAVLLAYVVVINSNTGRYSTFGESNAGLLDTQTGAVYIPSNNGWELFIKPLR